jgi:hypothetical protein
VLAAAPDRLGADPPSGKKFGVAGFGHGEPAFRAGQFLIDVRCRSADLLIGALEQFG